MADIKLFEIRDEGTFVPVMAIRPGRGERVLNLGRERVLNLAEHSLWARAGYGGTVEDHEHYVLMAPIDGSVIGAIQSDPFKWGGHRTLAVAHYWLREQVRHGNWHALQNGSVIDVQWLLGERDEPATSECGGERMLMNGVTMMLCQENAWPGMPRRHPHPVSHE